MKNTKKQNQKTKENQKKAAETKEKQNKIKKTTETTKNQSIMTKKREGGARRSRKRRDGTGTKTQKAIKSKIKKISFNLKKQKTNKIKKSRERRNIQYHIPSPFSLQNSMLKIEHHHISKNTTLLVKDYEKTSKNLYWNEKKIQYISSKCLYRQNDDMINFI